MKNLFDINRSEFFQDTFFIWLLEGFDSNDYEVRKASRNFIGTLLSFEVSLDDKDIRDMYVHSQVSYKNNRFDIFFTVSVDGEHYSCLIEDKRRAQISQRQLKEYYEFNHNDIIRAKKYKTPNIDPINQKHVLIKTEDILNETAKINGWTIILYKELHQIFNQPEVTNYYLKDFIKYFLCYDENCLSSFSGKTAEVSEVFKSHFSFSFDFSVKENKLLEFSNKKYQYEGQIKISSFSSGTLEIRFTKNFVINKKINLNNQENRLKLVDKKSPYLGGFDISVDPNSPIKNICEQIINNIERIQGGILYEKK